MFDTGNKIKLKALRKDLEGLIGELPSEAQRLIKDAKGLQAGLDARLGPLTLPVTARERTDFDGRMQGLKDRANALQARRQEAAPILRAEEVHAAEVEAIPDSGLRRAFATRSAERKNALAAIGCREPETDGDRHGRDSIQDLDAWQKTDRAFFQRFVKAHEHLQSVRAEARIRDLREALPGLQRRFIESGPSRELLDELRGLLEPLEKFRQRPKPGRIEEVQQRILAIEEWIRVLSEDDDLPAGNLSAHYQRELQSLHGDYLRLTEDWRNQDDEVFDGLFERSETLMRELTERAEQDYAGARERLARSREIYDQYGDPQINPGLAGEMTALLAKTPDSPYLFEDWLHRYRRADQEFADALGGDIHRLLGVCSQVRSEVAAIADQVRSLPLNETDDAERVALEREFQATEGTILEDAPIDAIIDTLGRHRNLAKRIDALHARASERAERLAADRNAIRGRAKRLDTLTNALGVTPPQSLRPLLEINPGSVTSIEVGYQTLDHERAALAGIEPDLISQCCARLEQRLAGLREIRAVLDDDLDLQGAELLDGGLDKPPSTLEEAEALLPWLEPTHQRLSQALEQQIERLCARRRELLEHTDGPVRGGPGTDDQELLVNLLQSLRDLETEGFDDRLELARQLRHRLRQVEHQIDSGERDEKTITDLRRHIRERLRTLSEEFPESASSLHHDRVSALTKEVEAAGASLNSRREQLRRADVLLQALEHQARREAAHHFARDLETIRHRGNADAEGSGIASRLRQPDRQLEMPGQELRQRVRELAERHHTGSGTA
ncbi:MAG: hypothetical protein LGR52_00995 [Candidatus Thiosymbion ectosymbiont of Robbea hypermnestra]|nr:hypothetical protein [Candidatus Thiosymbion ectosymbiont of Robbea hypermnestra]